MSDWLKLTAFLRHPTSSYKDEIWGVFCEHNIWMVCQCHAMANILDPVKTRHDFTKENQTKLPNRWQLWWQPIRSKVWQSVFTDNQILLATWIPGYIDGWFKAVAPENFYIGQDLATVQCKPWSATWCNLLKSSSNMSNEIKSISCLFFIF